MEPVYLDYNATTPVATEVAEAMKPFIDEYFGNPSSVHSFGLKAKMAVENARRQVAELLHCDPSEIVFTSGGTESNNYAIKGAALSNKHKGNHIITSSIEHPAVTEVCRYLAKNGFEITYLPVDEYGMVDPAELKKAVRSSTILVTIMHANNEIGTIQPIEEISKITQEKGIIFHSDAAQSVGKIETDVQNLGIDLLSIAGHKLYAPKGIGALYIRQGTVLEKLMHGADHEQNQRAGTENVLEIVGFGKACEIAKDQLEDNIKHYRETRDHLYALIKKGFPDIKLNGHPEKRLPNTLNISFPGIEANNLVSRLANIAVSAGAACHSESIDISAVLTAMNIPKEIAMGTIRFSTGRMNTLDEMEVVATKVIETVSSLMPGSSSENLQKSTSDIAEYKLTHYAHGLGCACKIEPVKLEKILSSLPVFVNENILVGTETSDDAAVYKISKDQAIVQSLDFFAPIVDDPYDFGAIAAANALSDIYAMGAIPLFGMNIVGFPKNVLPMEVLERILLGAHHKAKEAGIPVIGGHTIDDPEPKYGMVVTGIIDPEKIIRNFGFQPGDHLILTKPLGTGILTTAIKKGAIDAALAKKVTAQMATLNNVAADVMKMYQVHACTDITGFGLLGHLREMSRASKFDVEIRFNDVPFLPEVISLANTGMIPGGTRRNFEYVSKDVDFGKHTTTQQMLLCDAQTSGGLLIAAPESDAQKILHSLHEAGITEATMIGEVLDSAPGKIYVK